MGAIPTRFAAALRDRLNLNRAVETGTYLGEGTRTLAGIFPEVVTIELAAHYYRQAKEQGPDNATFLHGDSGQVLPTLVGEPSLYWLDGHWSGGDTAGGDSQCPLLAELRAIRSGGSPKDCILVDDARLYLAPTNGLKGWPSLLEIADIVEGYMTIAHDQIVIVPGEARDLAEEFALWRPWREWGILPRAARHLMNRGVLALDHRHGC